MDKSEWEEPKIVNKNGVDYVVLPVSKYNELLERAGIGVRIEIKPKEVAKKARVNVDKGKIKALHDAGWSVFDIAKDMGISVSTVYNNMPPLNKRVKSRYEDLDGDK